MRLGFHIPLHHPSELIERLGRELLEEKTYDWIEIKYPYDIVGFDGAPYEAAIRRLISTYDVGVSFHVPTHYDIGTWSVEVRRTILRQVKASLRFAVDLGASIAAIHPGTIMHMDIPAAPATRAHERLIAAAERRKDSARRLTVEALAELALYTEELKITLALENVLLPEETVYTAAELAGILDTVDHPRVRALFDCGHAHRRGLQQGPFVRELGRRLVHVHVNDNDGSCDLHMQIGDGTIDYDEMFTALRETDYRGAVVVETAYADSKELIESARRIRRYLR